MDQACPAWIASTSQPTIPVGVPCLDFWYLSVDQRDRGEPCLSHMDCPYLSVDHACPVWITSTCQSTKGSWAKPVLHGLPVSLNQPDRQGWAGILGHTDPSQTTWQWQGHLSSDFCACKVSEIQLCTLVGSEAFQLSAGEGKKNFTGSSLRALSRWIRTASVKRQAWDLQGVQQFYSWCVRKGLSACTGWLGIKHLVTSSVCVHVCAQRS